MRRTKGTGSLYRIGGNWYLQYRANGRQFARGLGNVSKAEAELKAKVFLEALPAMGIARAKAKAVGIPLTDVWSKFESKAKIAPKTLNGWQGNWSIFLAWAVKHGLHLDLDILPEHAEAFLASLHRRMVDGRLISADTAYRILKNVKHVLKAGAGFNA